MASYLNPGFEKYQESLNAKIYIDKSDLIAILNENITLWKISYSKYAVRLLFKRYRQFIPI